MKMKHSLKQLSRLFPLATACMMSFDLLMVDFLKKKDIHTQQLEQIMIHGVGYEYCNTRKLHCHNVCRGALKSVSEESDKHGNGEGQI